MSFNEKLIMEKELNIAAILKDKPKGTKLYSSACGKCELKEADDKSFKISFYSSKSGFMNGGEGTFDKNGNLYDDGECVVFPSKEMRDWEKFAWKRGDVLVDTGFDNINCIFDAYISEDYTKFRARYCYRLSSCSNDIWFSNPTQIFSTKEFMKDPCPSLFIKKIEEHYKGKLNLETLEIEKAQPEFKEGDILFVKCEERDFIEIFNYSKKNGDLYDHASLDSSTHNLDISGKYRICKDEIIEIRLATDSEKQQLFSALEKEGKRWNPDTKSIEDLPKKCEFKPFDKVLARNSDAATWIATLFGFYDRVFEGYVCIGDVFEQCIPYNEETKHLLGTTDEWKGGEQ